MPLAPPVHCRLSLDDCTGKASGTLRNFSLMDSTRGSNPDRHSGSEGFSKGEPRYSQPMVATPQSQRAQRSDYGRIHRPALRCARRISRSQERTIHRPMFPEVARSSNRSSADRDRPLRRHSSKQVSSGFIGEGKPAGAFAERRHSRTATPSAFTSSSCDSVRGSAETSTSATEAMFRGLRLGTSSTGERSISSGSGSPATSR